MKRFTRLAAFIIAFILCSAQLAYAAEVVKDGIFYTVNEDASAMPDGSLPLLTFSIDESKGTIYDMNHSYGHVDECTGMVTITLPEGYSGGYAKVFSGGEYKLEWIRGRGHMTWQVEADVKKPYIFKLEKKSDLFGMGKSKRWILLANAYDNALLRNRLSFRLADAVGLDYTSQCVAVDVMMNGEYLGSYLLCEQVRVEKSRVAIADLTENYDESTITDEELSGGYLLSPRQDDECSWFKTEHDVTFSVLSPYDSDEPAKYQKAVSYITGYIQRVENAVYGIPDEDGIVEDVWSLMDLDSMVMYYWIEEFSANGDGFGASTYLHKERDSVDENGNPVRGKLCWGPVWDYDYAYSATGYAASEGWVQHFPWIDELLKDPVFVEALQQGWVTFSASVSEITRDGGLLDSWQAEIYSSAVSNFTRWGLQSLTPVTDVASYYEAEVARLKTWMTDRAGWISANVKDIAHRETDAN